MVNSPIDKKQLATDRLIFPFFVFCLFSFVLLFISMDNLAIAQSWQELKGEHFKIYYVNNRQFAKKTLDKCEEYYEKIADDLGYPRYKKFWSWSKRVKIYIYPDYESYLDYIKKKGYAHWAEGIANYKDMEIISYSKNRKFLDAVLPHEITHLLFRDYVGRRNIPLWIDEGVAQWQEKYKRKYVKQKMKELLQYHKPIPIERLMMLNLNKIVNKKVIELFYVQSVSLIDFLVKTYGADNFISFCRQLRDGKDINEALKFSYPMSVRSVEELELKWLKDLWEEK